MKNFDMIGFTNHDEFKKGKSRSLIGWIFISAGLWCVLLGDRRTDKATEFFHAHNDETADAIKNLYDLAVDSKVK